MEGPVVEAPPVERARVADARREKASVQAMSANHVAAVVALAASTPEAARWSPGDYARAGPGDLDGWVATVGEKLVGFVIARRMADEMEILNLGVEPAHRRCGVASRLLEAALESGRARGAKRAFLEVRESNAGAIAFYQRRGFVRAGRRPRYYADPLEDALVLSRSFAESSL